MKNTLKNVVVLLLVLSMTFSSLCYCFAADEEPSAEASNEYLIVQINSSNTVPDGLKLKLTDNTESAGCSVKYVNTTITVSLVDGYQMVEDSEFSYTVDDNESAELSLTDAGTCEFTVEGKKEAKPLVNISVSIEPIPYNLSIAEDIAKGSVQIQKNEEEATTAAITATVEDIITVIPEPEEGYGIESVKYNDTVVQLDESGNYTFQMPAAVDGVAVSAEFLPVYNITISESEHGIVTADTGVEDVLEGSEVVLTATPDEGYALTALTANDEDVLEAKKFTIAADSIVSATFTAIEYNVNLQETSHGSFMVQKNSEDPTTAAITATVEDTITVFPAPGDGYGVEFVKYIKYNGTVVELDEFDNYTFQMPAESIQISVKFAKLYEIKIADGIAHGTVNATRTQAVVGATVALTETPDDGYVFNGWEVKHVDYKKHMTVYVETNPLRVDDEDTFTMPDCDSKEGKLNGRGDNKTFTDYVLVSANFAKVSKITINNGEDGDVIFTAIDGAEATSATAIENVKEGVDVALTAVAPKHQVVTKWNVVKGDNGQPVQVSKDGVFKMPASDVSIRATYEQVSVYRTDDDNPATKGENWHHNTYDYNVEKCMFCNGDILVINPGRTNLTVNGGDYCHIKVDKEYKGTLTLRNVVLENDKLCSDPVIDAEGDLLNLVIEGEVSIEANNALAAIRAQQDHHLLTFRKNIKISGNGTLSIKSDDGYGIHCKNLTINNTTVDIMAENHAIWAEGDLTIDGGKVIVGNEGHVSVEGCCAAVKVDGEFEIKGSHKAYLYAVNYSSVMPAVHFENVVSNEGIYALGNTFAIPYDYKNGKLRVIHYLKEELPRWNGMHHLAEPCQGDTYYDGWFNASTVYLRPAFVNVKGQVFDAVATQDAIITNASVSLMQGKTIVKDDTGAPYTIELNENGEFEFVDVPDGNYNIVVTVPQGEGETPIVVTVGITVPGPAEAAGVVDKDIVVTETNASSELDVKQDSVDNKVDTEKAVVTGLDKVAEEILKKEEGLEGGSVDVKLTVKEEKDLTTSPEAVKSEEEQKLAEQQLIKQYASGEAEVDFIDMKVEKTVIPSEGEPETTPLSQLPSVIEVIIPYDMSDVPEGVENPKEYYEQYVNVARNHNGVVQVFTKLDARPADKFQDGTCYVWYNTENPAESCVYIYTDQFSTYAIILGDISIPVAYTYYDNSYRIDVKIAQNGRGTVTTSKNWADYGEKITVTVVPQAGYKAEVNVYKAVNNAKVDLTENEDGTYSFNMPGCNAVVSVSFVCTLGGECPMAPYTDLDASKWYHDGIHFCIANKYMVGYEDMTFKPYADVTKAEFLAVLYRYAQAEGKGFQGDWMFLMPYTDLADIPAYANEAFAWMTTKQIIEADADGKINARDPITREEFVDIMYKFAQVLGTDVSIGEETNILSFGDATTICEGKAAAFQWAVGAQIMCGDLNGNLRPHDNASRAEAAVLLEEFYKNVVAKKKDN